MELIPTKCALCDAFDHYKILYKSNVDFSDFNAEVFSARRMPDTVHYQVVQCQKDGLVRSNPVCDSRKMAVLYQQSRFNYKDETENLTASYMQALAPVLSRLSRDARILEIGCGNGFVLKALQDRGYRQVFGVEPSADAVRQADDGIRGRIAVDILHEGLYSGRPFDLVFFFQTLDHIPDPAAFLKICHDVLLPGGYILAFNHNVESLSARMLGEKSPIIDVEHTYLFGPKTIAALFCAQGFIPERIYSPGNIISLRHLLRLMPFIPGTWKRRLLGTSQKMLVALLNGRVRLQLGNLCIVARKPE
ncbi:MAG: class I SAM-dependent methyltransferase [Candidatus Omnitrophica bacterium]|nr:class I SAM-dependent methyltransferase [Candidatus Omnitrophota bacterium]